MNTIAAPALDRSQVDAHRAAARALCDALRTTAHAQRRAEAGRPFAADHAAGDYDRARAALIRAHGHRADHPRVATLAAAAQEDRSTVEGCARALETIRAMIDDLRAEVHASGHAFFI